MIESLESNPSLIINDLRFKKGMSFFNAAEWYQAHDYFEDLWHETDGPERRTIQGILQIAVAQLHLERDNTNGAIILYGEGIGRLRQFDTPKLGLDIERLCKIVENRLKLLQQQINPKSCELPFLFLMTSQ